MPQKRVHWAVKAVGVAPFGSTSYTALHGVQSVGLSTSFDLQDVLELGQSNVYEIIEEVPNVEATIEKVLDGYATIYDTICQDATSNTLLGRGNERCMIALPIYNDTFDSASGTPLAEVQLSGFYVSSLSYTFPVEGNSTESVTVVGNNKIIRTGANAHMTGTIFDNTDEPLALVASSGGIQRREDVIFGGQAQITLLPTQIPGISSSGTNNKTNGIDYDCHVQNLSVSVDLGREQILELGRKGPYHRYMNIPVDVTTEIEIISLSGDMITCLEEGTLTGVNVGNNLVNETIKIVTRDGLVLDMGSRNKLNSINVTGGDTGGANETITYSYRNKNTLTVTHPQAP